MEALSSLIAKAEQGGFIRSFKIEGNGKSRLKFHTFCLLMIPFFFCNDYVEQLKYWIWVVICFRLVSSLKINLQKKSEIILVEETEDVNRVASLFGCKVGKLPTSNLGLPLGAPKKHCGVWNSIE